MSHFNPNLDRRRVLKAAAVSGLAGVPLLSQRVHAQESVINDFSQLNPVAVAKALRPHSVSDIQAALQQWPGHVSVGGGRFSMGGQIASPNTLHLDMRGMKKVVSFDPSRRVIRVEAGITWRDVQDTIDPHDLSVKIMQSYCNFTVGGSVSVNCHGRYVGRGPLINSVRAVQLVTANGQVLELTRFSNAEIFRAVFGGYGGLGVVAEVELDLEQNARIERVVQEVALDGYPAFFRNHVLQSPQIVLHNADLIPPNFDSPKAISWMTTEKPLTEQARLVPRALNYDLETNAIWAMTELPGGSGLRDNVINPLWLNKPAVVWRNREASLDATSLEPRTRKISTYLLQEYFIPVPRFMPFVRDMAAILRKHQVNTLNVSIRHSPADANSLLAWAPVEVFAFVLYYKQRTSEQASTEVRSWTQELVDVALRNGGRYYLPYRLDATREQFNRAYPEISAFVDLKARVDPNNRFRNLLWNKYLQLS